MRRFLVEHLIPDAAQLSAVELRTVAQQLHGALRGLGPDIRWLFSYVTGHKIYSVYLARDATLIRDHACLGGLPADEIVVVVAVIEPPTAE